MFCATGCFDVQIAELSAQLGLKQRISHAQDGCMVFMDVLLLWCADIWLHWLGTSFVHVGSSLELLLAKQRIFMILKWRKISQMLLGAVVSWLKQ